MPAGLHTAGDALSELVRLERTRIAGDVYDRADEIADIGLAAILTQIPGYAERGSEFQADVHDQLARLCRTGLTALLDKRRVTTEELIHTRRAAVRRARAGLPLIDYIAAFRLGQQAFWKTLMAHAGDSETAREATLSMVLPLTRYCDLICAQATNAYLEFQQYQRAEGCRDGLDLMDSLLAGRLPERGPQQTMAAAHGIGAEPAERLVVIAGTVLRCRERSAPRGSETEARHIVSAALTRVGVTGHRTLAVVRDTHITAVTALGGTGAVDELCARLEKVRANLVAEGIVPALGMSTVITGAEQIPRGWQEACSALELLPEEGGVLALPQLTPFRYLVLNSDDTTRRLVDPRITTALAEDRAKGAVLADTIRAFAAADMNLREAAEALRIHHNTAKYRLRRIQQLTGRNVRRLGDLVDLLLAIELDATAPRPARES